MKLLFIAILFALPSEACGIGAQSSAPATAATREIASVHTRKCGSCHTAPEPKTRDRAHLEARPGDGFAVDGEAAGVRPGRPGW